VAHERDGIDRQLLKYGRLKVRYGYKVKGPRVVHITLTKENLVPKFPRPNKSTSTEQQIPVQYRATKADYLASGEEIEKGHVCSAFLMRVDIETCKGIAFLSTVTPQLKKFNRGGWDNAERHVLWRLEHEYDEIDLFAGTLYVSHVGNSGSLPLASHLFMLLICRLHNDVVDVEIIVMPHADLDPGAGVSKYHKSYQELLAMDKENFIPRFELKNVRHVNGEVVTCSTLSPSISGPEK